jgi:hypothetical protein
MTSITNTLMCRTRLIHVLTKHPLFLKLNIKIDEIIASNSGDDAKFGFTRPGLVINLKHFAVAYYEFFGANLTDLKSFDWNYGDNNLVGYNGPEFLGKVLRYDGLLETPVERF